MNKQKITFLFVIFLAIILVGCKNLAKKDNLLGKWKLTNGEVTIDGKLKSFKAADLTESAEDVQIEFTETSFILSYHYTNSDNEDQECVIKYAVKYMKNKVTLKDAECEQGWNKCSLTLETESGLKIEFTKEGYLKVIKNDKQTGELVLGGSNTELFYKKV